MSVCCIVPSSNGLWPGTTSSPKALALGHGVESGFWRLTPVSAHRNWAPEQPDNWYGHGLGGGEDCAQFTSAGNWNDDACQRSFRWVCEAELAKAG